MTYFSSRYHSRISLANERTNPPKTLRINRSNQTQTPNVKLQHIRKMFDTRQDKPLRKPPFTSPRIPAFLTLPDLELIKKFSQILDHENTIASQPNSFLSHPEVSHRDRYPNIRPWAHNRVALNSLTFPEDYINASPVTLGQCDRYIATQGPGIGKSADHFWRMTWQENVKVIVMLTQYVEAGIEKCGTYLPLQPGDTRQFGPDFGSGHIDCLSRRDEEWGEIRELRLSHVHPEDGIEERHIHHLLFTRWPDHDVPRGKDQAALVRLIELSRCLALSNAAAVAEPPRIIHCSAGVGRTGVFITLDHLLQELKSGEWDYLDDNADPIFDTIKKLRDQRMGLVHTLGQYIFVYRILRNIWETQNSYARATASTEKEVNPSSKKAFHISS